MSDPLPPPSAPGSPPPDQPVWGRPAQPTEGGWAQPSAQPSAWGQQQQQAMPAWSGEPATARPPRPRVVPAAALIILGAVVMIIGTFLPWVTGNGDSINGWDLADMSGETNDAGVYVALGVILAGLAIAMLAAGRVLAVAIIAVVIASFAAIAAVIDVSDDGGMGAFGLSIGAGLYIILVAAIASLVGSIWALAIRRR